MSDKVKLCSCGFDDLELQAWSVEWHEAHKPYHLEVFPGVADDPTTLDNLDSFIAQARSKRCNHEPIGGRPRIWYDRAGSWGDMMGQGPGEFCERCVPRVLNSGEPACELVEAKEKL